MNIRIKRVLACLTACIMLAMSAPAALAEKAMQTKAGTSLYAAARTSSKKLMKIEKGQAVGVAATSGNWAKVTVNGVKGYMIKKYLTPARPEPKIYYAKGKTKLYKSAKTSSSALKSLPAGAELTVTAINGNWAKASYGGKNGYALKKYLSSEPLSTTPTPPAPSTPTPEPTRAPDEFPTLKTGDAGDAVKKLQTRLKELEWFFGDIGGNYQALTTQAVKDFQDAASLSKTGVADATTQKKLFSSSAPRNKLGDSTSKPASGAVREMDWWTSGIQSIFARGSVATVTDVKTKLSWKVYRSGGTNHADVQPLTAADSAAMRRAYGGAWSWERRAIWVSIGSNRYAASMNGMPHGNGSIITNNFDGHHCIHFTNSRTHGSNRMDELHQAAIKAALAAG